MIQSPLNYTGGKYRLLTQILPLFPKDIEVFVDLFCGGCNVGLNVQSSKVIYNDRDQNLIQMCETFRNMQWEQVRRQLHKMIFQYGLSLTSCNGYTFYQCDSSKGLADYNRQGFLKLRQDFNQGRWDNDPQGRSLALYLLVVYAFNNQIRFNGRGEFNLPVGKRDFNRNMERKLQQFIERVHHQQCTFTCKDFEQLDLSGLTSRDFVYADPPYLITCATYNEKGGWGKEQEVRLLSFLDELHGKNIRFALSNVLCSKGRENTQLIQWLKENSHRYRAVPLQYSYANSNYHIRDRLSPAQEVLVINY